MREIQKTDICERRVVHCPEHEASHYLTPPLPSIKRVTARFVSRSVCRSAYLRTAGRQSNAISSRVCIRCIRANRILPFPSSGYPRATVRPLESAGVLAVEKRSRDDRFALILSGQYEMFGAVDTMSRSCAQCRTTSYAASIGLPTQKTSGSTRRYGITKRASTGAASTSGSPSRPMPTPTGLEMRFGPQQP